MYNGVPSENIPSFLPVSATALLKTWFDASTIDKGLTLLREGAISYFFIYRNSAACMYQGQPLYLVYEKTKRIAAGFTIKKSRCVFCGHGKNNKKCVHLAALAILSLRETESSSCFPMPLLFKNSMWGKTADILFAWLSREKGEPKLDLGEREATVTKATRDGSLNAVLDPAVFPVSPFFDIEINPEIRDLHTHLQEHCLTENERALIAAGSTTRGFSQDTSLSNQICTSAYCFDQQDSPQISYDPESCCFYLRYNQNMAGLQLSIKLPKGNTFELLKNLGEIGSRYNVLPKGRRGNDVQLDAQGNIVVRPIIWLGEDRCYVLSEIKNNTFGSHYYFEEEGFFGLHPENPEAKITPPDTGGPSMPLFDFVKKDDAFTVEHKEIAAFLKRNDRSLQHADNRVAEAVLSIKLIDAPEKIIINTFRETGECFFLSCEFEIEKLTLSLTELLEKIKKGENLSVGFTTLVIDNGPLAWLYKIIQKSTWKDDDGSYGLKLSRGEFAVLITSIPKVENRINDSRLQQTLASLENTADWTSLNSALHYHGHLRDYQKNGLSWLHTLYDLGLGGLLADDMGLGKTHQALALLDIIQRDANASVNILIICPASVLLHWSDKIEQFYPDLRYTLYYGPDRDPDSALRQGIVLTTYAVARNDYNFLDSSLFDIIVYDEIQALKNKNTATHQTAGSLKARVKIGLSGTPIENSLSDLFALFDICLPGFFGTFEQFTRNYLIPIEKNGRKKRMEELSRRIHPFILRRSRAQVLEELPDLIEDTRVCELSEKQQQLYRETLLTQQPLFDELADERKQINYLHIFAALTRLKQICNHPCLIEKCTDPARYSSGKWDAFIELLHECIESDRKVVVFTQYLGMLDLMHHYLTSQKIGFGQLRGDMSIAKRKKMIDRFAADSDCKVFIASLLAGGTGIDLVAGKAVIHYDRWWNPAKEEQATARVHRMGQHDVVQLFRLMTKNTLEEKINAIIADKKQLSDSIIQEDEAGFIKQLNREQIVELFSI